MAAAMPYGAASRACYAVFHGARVLLFSAGIEPDMIFTGGAGDA